MKRIILYIGIIDIVLLWLVSIINNSFNYNRIENDSFLLSKNIIISKQEDIYNYIINSINNTADNTFKCSVKYANCVNDLSSLFNNIQILNAINNNVNTYNSYDSIVVKYVKNNEFNLIITKKYSDDEIKQIDNKINSIIKRIIDNNMSEKEKVRVIHDYLINNAIYDLNKINNKSHYKSNTAYGTIINGYAICSGYADSFAIFLDKLGIQNYKVGNNDHVWNVLKLGNKWYQVDITYDAPLTTFDKNMIRYDYFLKESFNDDIHKYNKDLYTQL